MSQAQRKKHMRTLLKGGREFLRQLNEQQQEELEEEAKQGAGKTLLFLKPSNPFSLASSLLPLPLSLFPLHSSLSPLLSFFFGVGK